MFFYTACDVVFGLCLLKDGCKALLMKLKHCEEVLRPPRRPLRQAKVRNTVVSQNIDHGNADSKLHTFVFVLNLNYCRYILTSN